MDNETAAYFIVLGLFGLLGASVAVLKNLISDLRAQEVATRAEAKKKIFVGLVVLVSGVPATMGGIKIWAEVDLRIGNAGRYATREGRTIHLHPSGITFQISEEWLEWYAAYHNNLHLDHRELRRIRQGHGEWDTEYGEVVNAALPFEHCAAHVGGEGWGWEGVSFADLQVRAYVTNLSASEIRDRIKTYAYGAAKEIGHGWQEIQFSEEEGWKHALITYPLWYGDYGGTGVVEFYTQDTGAYRLVLVFMGTGNEGEKNSILSSVNIPGQR